MADEADLRALLPDPPQRAWDKEQRTIDAECAAFIAASPFAVLATANAGGRCDASPRGGPPLALEVDVDVVFVHCGKALHRGQLWEPSTWPAGVSLRAGAGAGARRDRGAARARWGEACRDPAQLW